MVIRTRGHAIHLTMIVSGSVSPCRLQHNKVKETLLGRRQQSLQICFWSFMLFMLVLFVGHISWWLGLILISIVTR